MIQELLYASQSVQALSTLLKSAQSLSNYNEIITAVSEVNTKLMAANSVGLVSQEKQSALSSKINELEQEIMRLKNWEAERSNYERLEISRGVFSYVERDYVGNFESAHKLCCTCFDNTIQSTLQSMHVNDKCMGDCFEIVCQKDCKPIRFYNYQSKQ